MNLFREPEAEKSWLSPGEVGPSTPRPNRFGRKFGGTSVVWCTSSY